LGCVLDVVVVVIVVVVVDYSQGFTLREALTSPRIFSLFRPKDDFRFFKPHRANGNPFFHFPGVALLRRLPRVIDI
jgi:hypothetical protein